jgi:hypothetical protein
VRKGSERAEIKKKLFLQCPGVSSLSLFYRNAPQKNFGKKDKTPCCLSKAGILSLILTSQKLLGKETQFTEFCKRSMWGLLLFVAVASKALSFYIEAIGGRIG